MLTVEVVSKLYPWYVQHLRYKIQSDYNAHTSNASDKLQYRIIKFVHIGVKLLYDHETTSDWDATQWLPTPTVDNGGKVSIKKFW